MPLADEQQLLSGLFRLQSLDLVLLFGDLHLGQQFRDLVIHGVIPELLFQFRCLSQAFCRFLPALRRGVLPGQFLQQRDGQIRISEILCIFEGCFHLRNRCRMIGLGAQGPQRLVSRLNSRLIAEACEDHPRCFKMFPCSRDVSANGLQPALDRLDGPANAVRARLVAEFDCRSQMQFRFFDAVKRQETVGEIRVNRRDNQSLSGFIGNLQNFHTRSDSVQVAVDAPQDAGKVRQRHRLQLRITVVPCNLIYDSKMFDGRIQIPQRRLVVGQFVVEHGDVGRLVVQDFR